MYKKFAYIFITVAIISTIPVVTLADRTQASWLLSIFGTYIYPAQNVDVLIQGVNHYLNFGTFSGSSGYGLRDNSGSIEFKNSGGSWTGIGTGGGGGGSGGVGWASTTDPQSIYSTGTHNVGIGTTSPLAKLDIAGSLSQTSPLFKVSKVGALYATSTGLLVDSSGNVAIGKDNVTAGYALDVNGNIVGSGTNSLFYLSYAGDHNLMVSNSAGNTYTGISGSANLNSNSLLNIGYTNAPGTILTPVVSVADNGYTGFGTTYPSSMITTDASSTIETGGINSPFFGVGEYQNFLLQDEAFDNASWVKQFGSTVIANNFTNPRGDATTAEQLVASASINGQVGQYVTDATNGAWTFSVWLRSVSGTPTARILVSTLNGTATSTTATSTIKLTNNWQRYAVTTTDAGTVTKKYVAVVNGTADVVAWGAQLEPTSYARQYSGTLTTAALTTLSRAAHFPSASGLTVGGPVTTGSLNATSLSASISASSASSFAISLLGSSTPLKGIGYVFTNTTASTIGLNAQFSPVITLNGSLWDIYAGISTTSAWGIQNETAPQTPNGVGTSTLDIMAFNNLTGKYDSVLALNTSTSTIARNLYVAGTLRSTVSYNGDQCFANNFCWTESSSTMPLSHQIRQDGHFVEGLMLRNDLGETIEWIARDGTHWYKGQPVSEVSTSHMVGKTDQFFIVLAYGLIATLFWMYSILFIKFVRK